jgi:hypothetical protein
MVDGKSPREGCTPTRIPPETGDDKPKLLRIATTTMHEPR